MNNEVVSRGGFGIVRGSVPFFRIAGDRDAEE